MKAFNWYKTLLILSILLLFSASASASRLEVDADSHWFFHLGAAILLYLHIGGGALGIASGAVASLSVKGSFIHRMGGKVFVVSMLICYVIAAVVAPFLASQQTTNFVAAILALYLLMTGVSAAKRPEFIAGNREKLGLLIATFITVMGATFMFLSYQSPDGSVDGSPPQAYILFVVAAGLATIGEINALIRKRLSSAARTVRHLWRMCMSFFIASGSLFFGQMQLFPAWFQESLLPIVFGFFPLFVLVIYVIKFSVFGRKRAKPKLT